VVDFFLTPTAELADLVLPAATYLEMDSLHAVDSLGRLALSRKSQRWVSAGRTTGSCSNWPGVWGWGSILDQDEGALDFILKPAGLTSLSSGKLAGCRAASATGPMRNRDLPPLRGRWKYIQTSWHSGV